jgi:hypothetical protein
MMIDHFAMKLGKRAPRLDIRTLALARYVNIATLPPAPTTRTWSTAVKDPWGMMLNNTLGDCGIAGMGHAELGWNANAGAAAITIPDADILAGYEAVGGYVPGNPATDGGIVLLDGLNWWRQTGIAGLKIDAYAGIQFNDSSWVKIAINLFGGAYTGLALPLTAQIQDVWDVVGFGIFGKSKPNSWGGHCVWAIDYNLIGPVVVTWGILKQLTWAFWLKYCDEAYAVSSKQFLCSATGKTPVGLDLATMDADVNQVAA